MPLDSYLPWLRKLEADGGKGVVNNIDARSLGRAADEIKYLRSLLAPSAGCCAGCGRPSEPASRSLWKILAEVAHEHKLPVNAVKAFDMRRPFVRARWNYYYRACAETAASLGAIGRACGDRDHTTVGYGASMWAELNSLPPSRDGGLDTKARKWRNAESVRRRALEAAGRAA